MKIKWKLFFSTLLVVTLGFCMGGSLFLAGNFQHILDSRLEQAGLEHYTTQYVFELQLNGTIAITENHRSDILIKAAAWAAENLSWQEQTFCVSHEDGTILYSNFPARIGEQDILDTFENAPQGKLVSDPLPLPLRWLSLSPCRLLLPGPGRQLHPDGCGAAHRAPEESQRIPDGEKRACTLRAVFLNREERPFFCLPRNEVMII